MIEGRRERGEREERERERGTRKGEGKGRGGKEGGRDKKKRRKPKRKVALGAAVAVNGGGGSSFKVEIFFFLLSVLRIGPLSVKYWEISGGDFLFWVLIHSLWRCSSAFCSLLSPFEKQEA